LPGAIVESGPAEPLVHQHTADFIACCTIGADGKNCKMRKMPRQALGAVLLDASGAKSRQAVAIYRPLPA
jgi:hypothetical protein